MKKPAILLAAVACLSVALLSTVSAARDTATDRTRGGHDVYRTPDLIGKTVRNNAGDSLGHIEDFVVNMKNGHIAYAVLAHGEVLGFGGKMFAVDAADLKMAEDRSALLFDVTKDDLEKASGFDANKWPSQPDDRLRGNKRGGNTVGSAVGKAADAVASVADKDAELRRVTAIMRLAVKSQDGESLGQVAGLAMDLHNRKVVYVAMSRGGIAGVGTKYYALPWNALECKSLDKTAHKVFVIHASKDDFDKNGGFEWRNWPDEPDSHFKARNTRGS